MQLLVRAWLLGSEEGTLGVLPLISPTHLGWDFKGEEVETPGGQGLQRGKNRASAANGSFLGFSPLALCQPPQPMCTPCQLAFCFESPCFSLMPYPRFLDIQLVQPPPPTGYVFSALLHLCLLCPPGCLPLPAQVPLIPPPLPQSSPHQYSVLEFLGLCLQLHAMLLEHSPLAQAPPDAVCRWVVGCSGPLLP